MTISIKSILRGEKMIYINQYGLLKIRDETDYLSDDIPEQTIEIVDY